MIGMERFNFEWTQFLLFLSFVFLGGTCAFSQGSARYHNGGTLSFRIATRRLAHSASSDSSTVDTADASPCIWTEAELLEFSSKQGVVLSLTTLGPGYRAIARAKHDESQILGYVEGFLRPGGSKIVHLDKMEVFRKMILRARNDNPNEFQQGGSLFGVGLLMGYLCLLYGRDRGYTIGEFLAIDDEERQHRKLVQFYKRSGFEIIKYVGDDFQDIPDRLLWGGCGTLMRQDIDVLLRRWTQLLQKSATKHATTSATNTNSAS